MPSDRKLKNANAIHRAILKLSGGRLGWNIVKMPVLELTTIGRKSGVARSVMLTSPIRHDGAIVIVASRGGDPTHPAWFLNLQANPAVTVKMRNMPVKAMTARVATPEERDELWPQVIYAHSGYADYQTKTDREIPLVLLA